MTDPLKMKLTRRSFLHAATTTVAALALPLTASPVAAACDPGQTAGSNPDCDPAATTNRAPGDPSFEPFWVATHLPTKLWPTASGVDDPVEKIDRGRIFRVDEPQQGYRLLVWDPR